MLKQQVIYKKITDLIYDLAHQIDIVNSKLTKTEENLKNFVKSTVGSETGNRRKDIDKINKTLEILNHVELKKNAGVRGTVREFS